MNETIWVDFIAFLKLFTYRFIKQMLYLLGMATTRCGLSCWCSELHKAKRLKQEEIKSISLILYSTNWTSNKAIVGSGILQIRVMKGSEWETVDSTILIRGFNKPPTLMGRGFEKSFENPMTSTTKQGSFISVLLNHK